MENCMTDTVYDQLHALAIAGALRISGTEGIRKRDGSMPVPNKHLLRFHVTRESAMALESIPGISLSHDENKAFLRVYGIPQILGESEALEKLKATLVAERDKLPEVKLGYGR